MVEFSANLLAELVTNNILIFHDSAQYDKLEKNTFELIIQCGYNDIQAKTVAHKIRLIYENYDLAQLNFEKNFFEEEKKFYDNAYKLAEEINKYLFLSYDCKLMVSWVIYWRHKKFFRAFFIFFLDWSLKLKNPFKAIQIAFFVYSAGFSHDKRDLVAFKEKFEKIWKIAISSGLDKMPIFF